MSYSCLLWGQDKSQQERTPGKPCEAPGRWRLETHWLQSLSSPMSPFMVGTWNDPTKAHVSYNLVGFLFVCLFGGEVVDPLGGDTWLVEVDWPHISDVCFPPAICFLVLWEYSRHHKLHLAFSVSKKCTLLNTGMCGSVSLHSVY